MPKNLLKKTFNFFQKIFDKTIRSCYHIQVSDKQTEQNSIRPDGQAVKTTPSHGVNPGSIPGQVIEKQADICLLFCCLYVIVPQSILSLLTFFLKCVILKNI